MKHLLPPLPYAYDGLEPYIDARTMEVHHTKHHQTYIDKLNTALEFVPELHDKTPEYLVSHLDEVPENIRTAVRNHGGGHVNHSFFWQIMTPHKETPSTHLIKQLEKVFGSFDNFKTEFAKVATNHFGSGWTWLVSDAQGNIKIISLPNQDSPLSSGLIPLLGLDIWEHAYYLKYQNRRAEYIEQWFNVISWSAVERRLNTLY